MSTSARLAHHHHLIRSIIIAHENETIIGYVTFHYADDCERWSEGNMTDLIELGAIEVADNYRSLGIGREMLLTALEDKTASLFRRIAMTV